MNNVYSINYTNKLIVYVSGGLVDTVRDLYSWLMDQFDELGTLDDTIPMSAQTPTEFTLINGWFIDDETMKTLKNGAITTSGWKHGDGTGGTSITGIRVLTLDAAAGLTVDDIGKAVLGGTTTDTGKLLAYNVTLKKLWVRCDAADDLFDNVTEAITVDAVGCGNMTIASQTGESVYGNIYTLGTIESGGTVYIAQADAKITGWWSTGHIDVIIKVKEFDTLIDSGNLIIFLREFQKGYDHFPITVTSGRNAVPLATSPDVNNTTAEVTVSGWTNVTFTFSSINRDLNNGNGAQPYDVEVDCGGRTVAQVYERMKWVCRSGSTEQLQSDNGEEYISCNGAYSPVKISPFGTFAGGKFFGARGVWITNYHTDDAKNFQLIDADGDTQAPPNTVTMKVTAVVAGDRVSVFRLTGVGGSIKKDEFGGCTAQAVEATSLIMASAIDADVAGKTIGGIVRLEDNDLAIGYRLRYSSWAGSTFTLASATLTPEVGTNTTNIKDTGAFTAALCKIGDLIYNVTQNKVAYVTARVDDDNVTISPAITSQSETDTIKKNVLPVATTTSDDAYAPFVDGQVPAATTEISNTLVQSTNIPILVRVRKYGGAGASILPFEIESLIESTGKSIAAIRKADSIVL